MSRIYSGTTHVHQGNQMNIVSAIASVTPTSYLEQTIVAGTKSPLIRADSPLKASIQSSYKEPISAMVLRTQNSFNEVNESIRTDMESELEKLPSPKVKAQNAVLSPIKARGPI
jgi:hypothetical protein